MIKSKYHPLKVWASTIGLVAGSQFVYAQEEPMTEEVIVTGFRSVLMQSQAIKRENSSISEVITAEDIGKLPDTSVAESLARLPGLAGERRNGRTSGLSVRGFNENYVGTTLNGRELLGMGDNRGVEYDLYPAEIISSVVINKTPDASLITQGIGGTVDLRTIRPLEKTERVLAVNGSYEMNGMKSANPDYDDKGHRLSFTYADKFMDDTVGVAVSIATMESPSQEEQFRGWGYAGINADNPTLADGVTLSEGDVVLGGHDSFVRSALMARDSIAGVVQFEPTDELSITVDALYIDFSEDKVFRGMEEGGAEWGTSSYNIDEIQDGLVTAGSWDGFRSVIRNDAESKTAELTTFGLNVEYAFNDIWSAEFDYSTGEVSKNITNIESYSGVGRALTDDQGPAAARAWEMTPTGVMYSAHPTISSPDYTNQDLVRLAGPQAWGGALAPIDEFAANEPDQPLGPNTAQDGFVNSPDFDETLDSLRIELNGDIEYSIVSGVKVGLNYTDRSKTKTNQGAFLTAPTWPGDGAIPSEFIVGTANLNFIGIGDFIAYDSLGLYNSGGYTATDAARLETGRMGDSYTVDEQVTTLFAMADLTTSIGDIEVTGNAGFQFVDTTQKSSGFDSVIGSNFEVLATPVSAEASYTKFLPSINLSFSITDEHVVRTALSKTISRPRMDDMRPNNQISFQFNDAQILEPSDVSNSPWTGSSGNPTLRPLEANQFDLAYEYYFADDGIVTAAFFYKDLVNWHDGGETVSDFSDYYIEGYHESSEGEAPVLFEGIVSNRADGLEGFAKGLELQASVPFHLIHDSLDGFGIIATGTFSRGELGEDKALVPGLSKEIYQLTAYYEAGGFEFRISGRKRSEYLSETRGLSLALTDTIDTGSELWDAQIGYDFSEVGVEGLSVTLQAQNITNEDTVQFNEGDPRQITQYQSFGANYLLGVNYTF